MSITRQVSFVVSSKSLGSRSAIGLSRSVVEGVIDSKNSLGHRPPTDQAWT